MNQMVPPQNPLTRPLLASHFWASFVIGQLVAYVGGLIEGFEYSLNIE